VRDFSLPGYGQDGDRVSMRSKAHKWNPHSPPLLLHFKVLLEHGALGIASDTAGCEGGQIHLLETANNTSGAIDQTFVLCDIKKQHDLGTVLEFNIFLNLKVFKKI